MSGPDGERLKEKTTEVSRAFPGRGEGSGGPVEPLIDVGIMESFGLSNDKRKGFNSSVSTGKYAVC